MKGKLSGLMIGIVLLAGMIPLAAQDDTADDACQPAAIVSQVGEVYQSYSGGDQSAPDMETAFDNLDMLSNNLRAIQVACDEARYQAYLEGGVTLLEALRGGGYVMYVRHTKTDQSQEDTDLASCETQRNLNEQGRLDAAMIGEAWATLAVPVDRIISTEYCRTRETAQLAFGEPTVVPRAELETTLDELLAEIPSGSANTVIVGHVDLLEQVTGIQIPEEVRLNEGDALVYRPMGGAMGDGGYEMATRISLRNWSDLARIAAEIGMS
jgi:phosphohistidine phosphatase SixA